MKKPEVLDLFVKEVVNDGTDIYVLWETFIKDLKSKGTLKQKEIHTAHNLKNELMKRGWTK